MKHTHLTACALALLIAPPAFAQDIVFSMEATDACLAEGGTPAACAGKSTARCSQDTEGGETTVGMGGCADAEWQAWDARLNDTYKQAMAVAEEVDRDKFEHAPSEAEALREMQRAWIVYRDRACDWERAQWGGGTGGGPASLMCLATETARQTGLLQSRLPE